MNNYRVILLNGLFLTALICNNAVAQQNPAALSLKQAVDLALKNYPSVLSKQAQVNAAKANVTEAKNAWLPALNMGEQVNAGTDNSIIGAYFPMGVIPSGAGAKNANDADIATGNIASVAGQWEVYNFGKYRSITNEAKASLNINESSLENENYRIESAVIQNYLLLVKYRLLLYIQLKNIARTTTIKNAIQAFVAGGLRAGVDTSVAEAELSKDRLTYIELVNTYTQIKLQLSALTGQDTATIIPDTTINTQLGALLTAPPVSDTGYLQQPLLKYYHAIYEDNMAQLNLIQKNNLPKVYVMATGWMRGSSISSNDVYDNNPAGGLAYTRYNYLAGLAISYNLVDIRNTQLKANVQRFHADAALEDYNEQKTLFNQSLNQVNATVRASTDALTEIPIQQRAAADAYTQKLAMYNAGLTNIVDVTNALYLLNRAETDYVTATDAAWNAVLQRAYYSNTLPQLLNNLK